MAKEKVYLKGLLMARFNYNYRFSQSQLSKNMTILITSILIGLSISFLTLVRATTTNIAYMSVGITLLFSCIFLYFFVFRNWHKNKEDYFVELTDNMITVKNLYGTHETAINEIKEIVVNFGIDKKISLIRLNGKKSIAINRYIKDLDSVLMAIKNTDSKIAIQEKMFNHILYFLLIVGALCLVFLPEYLSLHVENIFLKALLDKLSILIIGVYLFFSPPFEKGILRGRRKKIVTLFLIFTSIMGIILKCL